MNVLEARRRTLGADVYKKTVQGNPVSVRSLARMRPGLKLFGRSTQKTTTGAQLIPFEVGQQIVSRDRHIKGTITENGIQIEALDGASASNYSDLCIVGTTNSSNEIGYREVDTLPAGKYKLSCSDRVYRLYVVVWRNGASVIIGDSLSENKRQFTVEDGDKFRIFLRPVYSGITGIRNVKFIVEKEDNNIDWEIFTGGQPSPSPDYPQPITSAGKYNEDTQKWDYEITIANAQTDATKNQSVTLTSDRPLTKWDRLEKRNGQWGWVYKSAEIESYTDESVPGEYYSTTGQLSVGAQVWYETATETFVPLSPEEQESMNALYTFRPTTVLSNDCECEMTLTYKTKKSLEVAT